MQTDIQNLLARLQIGDKIELMKLPTGQIIVTSQTKEQILQERYSHLIDQPITVSDAAQKYKVVRTNLVRWKNKGYITVIQPGYQMTLNEAEVAYCVDTHQQQQRDGIGKGTPLFDDYGLPYQLKHPKLSKYRRKRKN